MRAILLEKFGGPDSLVIKEIPEPERAGHVVTRSERLAAGRWND
jgi:NADPH:quinone reductase-like Zn-dependent oxidoreductase